MRIEVRGERRARGSMSRDSLMNSNKKLLPSGRTRSQPFTQRQVGSQLHLVAIRLSSDLDDLVVSGTTVGCVTAPSGYFRAVRSVCDKYGVLLVLDEIMCGCKRPTFLSTGISFSLRSAFLSGSDGEHARLDGRRCSARHTVCCQNTWQRVRCDFSCVDEEASRRHRKEQ